MKLNFSNLSPPLLLVGVNPHVTTTYSNHRALELMRFYDPGKVVKFKVLPVINLQLPSLPELVFIHSLLVKFMHFRGFHVRVSSIITNFYSNGAFHYTDIVKST